MNIRFATIDDITKLHDLVHRAYRGDTARRGWTHEADLLEGQRTDLDALRVILADPEQRILLAEEDGAVWGCVNIAKAAPPRAYLGMLSVDPDRQAGGLGRKLLAAAEDAAVSEFGSTEVEMTVISRRTELVAWYERRGYRLTGEERPFPLDDRRFGEGRTRELVFVVLAKPIGGPAGLGN